MTKIIKTIEPESGHVRYYEGDQRQEMKLLSSHSNLQIRELETISDEERERKKYGITKIDKQYFNDGNVEIRLITPTA